MVASASCAWYRCLADSNNESTGGADPSDPDGASSFSRVVGVIEGRGAPMCGVREEWRGTDCLSRATRSASRLERGERATWVDGVAAESIGVAGALAGRRCAGGTAPRYAMISHAVLPVSSAAA